MILPLGTLYRHTIVIPMLSDHSHWGESSLFQTSVAIVIVFWLKWAKYLAVAGLNLLALIE